MFKSVYNSFKTILNNLFVSLQNNLHYFRLLDKNVTERMNEMVIF